MRKINGHYLDSLLDDFLKQIFMRLSVNRLRVFLFVFIVFMWSMFTWLPYLNLVFTKELAIFLYLASFFTVFKISWKIILYFCLGLFLTSYLFNIFGLLQLSELLGDYIYGLLVLVVIGFFSAI